jgi:hypothetical protein
MQGKKPSARICNHASGPVIMKRIYIRNEKLNFQPLGWYFPDCRKCVTDED